jgi:uncharacterized protein (TIGR03084 family)
VAAGRSTVTDAVTSTVFDDLEAEEVRLEACLANLDEDSWLRPSGAPGWTVADVVLHLAQSEELVAASARSSASDLRGGTEGTTLDEIMGARVEAERAAPQVVFDRWTTARRDALDVLRSSEPGSRIAWATNPLSPTTLATTRLAEHWAHALDVTEPLGIHFADTPRLRHIAWLGHRTLPYAFSLTGRSPAEVRCELTGPGGEEWHFGPDSAPSRISGPAGDFCRVGAQRLDPDGSRLVATGPFGTDALHLLRNYAV